MFWGPCRKLERTEFELFPQQMQTLAWRQRRHGVLMCWGLGKERAGCRGQETASGQSRKGGVFQPEFL